MAAAFSITTASNELDIDADHAATVASFTVANITGATVHGQAQVVLDGPGSASWFTFEGASDAVFSPGEAAQFLVAIAVPRQTAGGIYRFRIDVRSPETGVSDPGPEVALHVPDPPPPPPPLPRGYLPTFVGAVAGDLVLLVASMFGFGGLTGFGPPAFVLVGGVVGAYVGLRYRQIDQPELTVGVLAAIQVVLSLLLFVSPYLFVVVIAVPPLPARGFVLWRQGRFSWPWVIPSSRPVTAR